MRVMSSIAAAALIAAAFMVAPEAQAQRRNNQGGGVVVVNYQRIAAESAIGRDMTSKLQGVAAQIQQEAAGLQPEGQSIEQERQRLATATRNMTREQVRAHASHGPALQALETRVQQFQQRQASLQGDLECTQALTLREFDAQVRPVIRAEMDRRGASTVLDASNVLIFQPDGDITNTVIQALDQNQATRVANVSRRPLSQCQQQPAAAPAQ
ncbi:MAG TPA: OmpH family outer membrane protein [Terricaulis sp.]|nr:OmpH family outer membrane protein [Terricaulis sp.]